MLLLSQCIGKYISMFIFLLTAFIRRYNTILIKEFYKRGAARIFSNALLYWEVTILSVKTLEYLGTPVVKFL